MSTSSKAAAELLRELRAAGFCVNMYCLELRVSPKGELTDELCWRIRRLRDELLLELETEHLEMARRDLERGREPPADCWPAVATFAAIAKARVTSARRPRGRQ